MAQITWWDLKPKNKDVTKAILEDDNLFSVAILFNEAYSKGPQLFPQIPCNNLSLFIHPNT